MSTCTPPMTKFIMEPTLATADPQVVTWHTDFANALNASLLNFLTELKVTWMGVNTVPGTPPVPVPMGGNAMTVITPILFTPFEIRAACIGEITVPNLFGLIATKLEVPFSIMVGVGAKGACSPLVLTPQVMKFVSTLGTPTSAFQLNGMECYNKLKSKKAEDYVDNKALFYDIFDTYLVKALNTLTATLTVAGPTATGMFAGSGSVNSTLICRE